MLAAHAGGVASRGQIQIEVVADTSKFPAQVERELQKALKALQVQPVKVKGDTTEFDKSVKKSTQDAEKSFSNLFDDLQQRASVAGAGVGRAFGAALAPALIASAAPAIQGLIAILAGIGPAALTAIPAAVGVIGTLQVALFGVSDALKEVGSDQKKYDEATKNLAPSAKAFTDALRGLLPQLTAVKNSVQGAFFAGFNKDLKTAAGLLLGPAKTGMTQVATALNGIIHGLVGVVASSKGVDALNGIFSVTSIILAKIGGLLAPLVSQFLDFVIAGTKTEAVNAALAHAQTILVSLSGSAQNLGQAFSSVFSGFGVDADSTVNTLFRLTAALRDFLATAEAQTAIKSLKDILTESHGVLSQILTTLPQLLPVLANVASGGFGVLTTAVGALLTALQPFVEFLNDNPGKAQALGVAIGTIVVAIKAYQAALVIATAAQIAWQAITVGATAAAYAFGVAFRAVQLAVALASIQFYKAGAAITTATAALWENVAAGAANALQWTKQAIAAVASGIQQVASNAAVGASWLIIVARSWLAVAATTAYNVAQRAAAIATNAWTAAQWLLNVALDANPIGLVIIAIVALVAAIVIAYQKSDTFRAIVQAAFSAIATAAIWLWNNALKPLWDGIVAGFNLVVAAAILWWHTVTSIFNTIVGAAISLYNGVNAAFSSLVRGVTGYISALLGVVLSLPGKILGEIGNLGSLLYNAGRSIIQGLINGIESMISYLTSKLSFVTNLIPDWKGPLDRDRALLRPAGQAIMQGLGAGIDDGQMGLQRQLAGVTQTIAATPLSSGQTRGGDGAALQPGGVRLWPSQPTQAPAVIQVQSDGSKVGDLLVEVISKAVRIRGGDVQQVLSGKGGAST